MSGVVARFAEVLAEHRLFGEDETEAVCGCGLAMPPEIAEHEPSETVDHCGDLVGIVGPEFVWHEAHVAAALVDALTGEAPITQPHDALATPAHGDRP